MSAVIRLTTRISAGKTIPLNFGFQQLLADGERVSNPVVGIETEIGDVALTATAPSINADGDQVSVAITCPATARGGRWIATCNATIGAAPYKNGVSARIVQAQ